MRRLILAAAATWLMLGCGGAYPDIRKDRALAVLEDLAGKRLVLVSDAALADAPETFHRPESDEEWTGTELERSFQRLIQGGRCRISGATIPPMTPAEAKDFWCSMILSCGIDLRKQSPELSTEDVERQARSFIGQSFPLLVGLAEQYDPRLTLQRPPKDSEGK